MTTVDQAGNEVEVRHFYFGRKLWPKHHGVLTAGAIVDREAKTLKVAFAHCSPLDSFRRYGAAPLTRRKRDEHGNVIYKNGNAAHEQIEQHGGLDIVHARLGLAPLAGVDVRFYTGEYNGSVLQGVMDIYNKGVPVEDKPQLWHKRYLLLAPRGVLAREGAWTRKELLDVYDKLPRKTDVQPGFVHVF